MSKVDYSYLKISDFSNAERCSSFQYTSQHYQTILHSLLRICPNLTLSLRYYYDRTPNPSLQTYLILKTPKPETLEEISTFITKGQLSQFFTFEQSSPPPLTHNLNWVNCIGEILKPETFLEAHNYYLPYPFNPEPKNDMTSVLETIDRLDGKFILEITLKPYSNPSEKVTLFNAIQETVTQLEQSYSALRGAANSPLANTLTLYRNYQQNYTHHPLFQYSIKAIAEHRPEASLILHTLANCATRSQTPPCQILLIDTKNPQFVPSLQATANAEFYPTVEWEGWQQDFPQMTIKNAIQPPRQGLSLFDDGSLSLPNFSNPKPPAFPSTSSSDLTLAGESALAKFLNTPRSSRIIDLKPLHRLVTPEEISGFFCIAVSLPKPETKFTMPKIFTLEEVIEQYKEYITEDTYFVGLDFTGQPCISSWSETPHRLIAGIPGTGKTNFLKSVIYQFFYANPERKLYVADFQAGMHYQLIEDLLQPNFRMVIELEEFKKLLEELWIEHQTRRNLMRENRVTSLDRLNQKLPKSEQKSRLVLIIDEAAYILNAERKIRDEIKKHLTALSTQSRVTGIHLIYCSQRPTLEVVPKQISDNMDERVIFPVQEQASSSLLGDIIASKLPRKPRGRAIYQGLDPELKRIATPYVSDEIWESLVCRN